MVQKKQPRIIIAIDSFKGCLSSLEAAEAVERGILRVLPSSTVVKVPVADGGEGTVDALVDATQGEYHYGHYSDPLGRKREARFGLSNDKKTAFIEVAETTGLTLVEPEYRNPLKLSSKGVGEQIKTALDIGVRAFIICLGGSATVDCGTGMLAALGARFYSYETELDPIPDSLKYLTRIDLSGLDNRLNQSTFLIACDVDNPLTGSNGASFIFGPQKGATLQQCSSLDEILTNIAIHYENASGVSILHRPMMGAAGGISAAFAAFFPTEFLPGIELVLRYLDFNTLIQGADLIITGEGSLDSQSIQGKTPYGICKIANKQNIPVIALAGKVELKPKFFLDHGFTGVFSIANGPITLEYSLQNAQELLAFTVENIINIKLAY